MAKEFNTLKLEKLDPTGVVYKEYSFEYEREDDESMRQFRYFLTIGDHIHLFTKDGEYKRKMN